ncbi:hypothetical protein E2R51_12470 [Jeotgalibacillus sp. S-D1]|uniref:hypothetical protein n=1 Tax=Jeotgalibacillus sp. S-D1 TaxID=2552189 RepID=UPI00105A7098|nr:hypothetical protein [Jeotgalibacillus sp. S-D1]TDL32021.1 hypothetical protein E2R51_12470 [Jeotgalibacillus sp. S-D1]
MENNKSEKDYAEYNHDNKTVKFGGKPAMIVSVFAGVTLLGLAGGITYLMTKNSEETKELATKVLKEVTKQAA